MDVFDLDIETTVLERHDLDVKLYKNLCSLVCI